MSSKRCVVEATRIAKECGLEVLAVEPRSKHVHLVLKTKRGKVMKFAVSGNVHTHPRGALNFRAEMRKLQRTM